MTFGGVRKRDPADSKKIKERQTSLTNAVTRHFSFEDARKGGYDRSEQEFNQLKSYVVLVAEAKERLRNQPLVPGPPATTTDATQAKLKLDEQTLRPAPPSTLVTEKLDDGRGLKAEAPKAEEDKWMAELRSKIKMVLAQEPVTPQFEEFEKIIMKDAQKVEDIAKIKSSKDEKKNFPELDQAALEKIQKALAPGNGIVVEQFNIQMKKTDIATLRDGQWLNDEVINFYGNLIMERAKQDPTKYPKVHVFNTNFFSYLRDQGYKSVQRWTRRYDLFSFDYVLIPVHWTMHWCFAAINFKKKRIEYYDSLHGSDQSACQLLRDYLEAESKDKKKKSFDFDGWTDYIPRNIPSQKNGYDCGVFTCMFAEWISREEGFDFSQTHMKYLRNRMIYEIVSAKLML